MKLSLLSAVLFAFNSSATATAHQNPSRDPSLKASGNKANLRGSSQVFSFQDYVKSTSKNGLEISSGEEKVNNDEDNPKEVEAQGLEFAGTWHQRASDLLGRTAS